MDTEAKLALLEALEEEDRFTDIPGLALFQTPEDPTLFTCNYAKVFPHPVTLDEADKVLRKYNLRTIVFID